MIESIRDERVALLAAGFAVACASAPAPVVSAVEEPRTPPTPDHEGPPERRVWTTGPNVDACEEFLASEAPPHSLFDSRAQCDAWVSERICTPGMCFDGCNTVSCDGTGMEGQQTLLACFVEVTAAIEFRASSAEPVASPPPGFAAVQAELARALEARGRKVLVIGHVEDAEAATEEGREQLRLRRAELARGLLIAAGLPGDRLFAGTQVNVVRFEPLPHERFVTFELDPSEPTRTDAVNESRRGDLPWCDDT